MKLRLLVVLVGCMTLSVVASAQNDADKAQAREQFNQGITQYAASQYDAALESFQEAYRLSPHPLVRVNMANCYDRLGKPVEALFHFEHFMRETEGDRSRDAQRSEVESAIRRLKRSVGELVLRVIPDGSSVRVDDAQERQSPIVDPIRLAAGDHEINVTRAGFASVQRHVQIRGGETATVNITLDREQVSDVVAPVPPPAIAPLTEDEEHALETDEPVASTDVTETPMEAPTQAYQSQSHLDAEPRPSVFTPPVIVAGVVSGTLLIASGLMGLLALSADADFDSFSAQSRNPALSMPQQDAARRAAFSAADTAEGRALAADLLFAGALISGAAAVIFVLSQDDADADDDLALQVGPFGAGVHGRF